MPFIRPASFDCDTAELAVPGRDEAPTAYPAVDGRPPGPALPGRELVPPTPHAGPPVIGLRLAYWYCGTLRDGEPMCFFSSGC